MQINKKLASIICTLILTVSFAFVALPISAHTPPWAIPTYSFIAVKPNPVGVNQIVTILAFLDAVLPGATVNNDIRFRNVTLVITRPNGSIITKNWDVVTDTSGGVVYRFTPNQIGEWTLTFSFPGQVYTWVQGTIDIGNNYVYQNDTYLPSSKTLKFTVQEAQIPDALGSYPLPTEYWTRPIEGQNTDWWKLATNWLGRQSPQLAEGRFMAQPDGNGPKTPHIMWTKPIIDGGVVGGTNVGTEGNMFYGGYTYNRRFNNPIIIEGRLYYPEIISINITTTTTDGPIKCVDLRTGEEIWSQMIPGPNNIPQFGYLYDYSTPNGYGVLPPLLFTADFTRAFDARTGTPLFNVTKIPITRSISPTTSVGLAALGPRGEILLYVLNSTAKWLGQWNSSRLWNIMAIPAPTIPSVVDASTANRYDWNISLPWLPTGSTIVSAFLGDIVLGRNGSLPTPGVHNPYTMWAINLNASRGEIGRLLWMKNYDAPAVTRAMPGKAVDPVSRVFITFDKETFTLNSFSLDDGELLWTSGLSPSISDFATYNFLGAIGIHIAYGRVYFDGYGGVLHSWDAKNGTLLYTYGNGGPGNSTDAGYNTPYDKYNTFIAVIANGVIYLDNGEHSANTPLYKGARIRAVDAYTGKELWTMMGWGGHHRREGFAVADGYLVYLNAYNQEITSIGRGPSATTVTSPDTVQPVGTPIMIKGTVLDVAAGTTQDEQKARFPNGVPAVSDASMSSWMEYVYMQKPIPRSAKGVDVKITVVDPNNNAQDFTTTSDSQGLFSYMWTPPVAGKYTVYAQFAGSEGYWPSYAETVFGISEAPSPAPTATPTPTVTPTTPPPTVAPTSPSPSTVPPQVGLSATDLYLIGAAVIVVIVVVAAAVLLKRRK
ncbi:MAG TPA: hypothetical protein VJ066_03760 [Candidatus Bathyarchaeia archaeon]|nr:hypothetical protein [Candidatus Bathyarchaeia archaeon]